METRIRFRLTLVALIATARISGGLSACAREENVPKNGSESPTISPALSENVQGLLEEGYQTGPKHLQAAQKKFDSARLLAPADPRIGYAWGLVLLRHNQSKQAIAQFETAVGRTGVRYWPAWQALIGTQLAEKQYEKGLARLEEFAELVRGDGQSAEPTDGQRDAARWMGQVLAALDKTTTVVKTRDLFEASEDRLRETLGSELGADFNVGQEMMASRHAALLEERGLAAEKKQTRRRESQKNKLGSDLKDLEKQKESTTKSVEEWKKWLDDKLTDVDKQIGRLEKDYQRLQDRCQSLEQSMLLLTRELTSLELQINSNPANQQGAITQRRMIAQQLLMQRQNQMLAYESEYNASIVQMAQTAQMGQNVMQERAGVVQKYEKATGDLVKKNADIEKWSTRVADRKKKLDAQPVGKAKAARVRPDQKTVSFRTLTLLDLELEKARLLEAYGASAPATAAIEPAQ